MAGFLGSTEQPKQLTDVLAFEEDQRFSRKLITVLENEVLVLGQVLGKVAASGKYVALNPEADPEDGSETAAGVLLKDVDATGADKEGLALVRHGIVKARGLVWPEGISSSDKADAIAQLAEVGILVREDL
jgi:hypothetical protein